MRLSLVQKMQPGYSAQVLASVLGDVERQVNNLTEGKVQAVTNASTAAPTGTAQPYNVGDFVRKSDPAEVTAGGLSYVIIGYICTVAGSPGTWEECRVLTADPSGISSVLVNDAAADTTTWPVLAGSQTGAQTMLSDGGLTYNASTNVLTAGGFTTAGQVTVSIATGTAPLVITSTTRVSNLNVAQAGVADTVTVADAAADTTTWPLLGTAQTGNLAPASDAGLTYNANTNQLAVTGTYAVGANQVVTARQTGWGTPSSTLLRTTYATYAGTTFANSTYAGLFTDLQTLDDHVKGLSQRLGALITDLITHGLIGA